MRLATFSAVLLVAACGGGPTSTPDASPLGNAVRVTVTQGGQPVAGLNAYFLDADGTLVATVITDADGRASVAALDAGSSVTVMHAPLPPSVHAYELDSWVGVQPGDDLALDLPVARSGMNVRVSVPVAPMAGVAEYSVTSPCGSSPFFLAGQTAELQLAANCLGDAQTTDFTVFARNPSDPIAAFVAPMIEVTPDIEIELDGDYEPLVGVPIRYAHVGSEQHLTYEARSVSDRGQTGVAVEEAYGTPGSLAGTFPWPAQLTTGTRVIDSFTGTGREVLSWAPVTSSVSFDWMDQLGQEITSQATIVAERQLLVTWTLADDGAPAQMAIASLEVDDGDGTYVGWTIVAPGATPQIALPQLPSSLINIPNPAREDVGLVLLRVPGGTPAWTQILGAGGYRAGFRGLISASPSGEVSKVSPSGSVIPR